ncbi:hypothetical protein [Arsenophonus endosymbiont of Bemisia tabaci]|nr:hypothetical protein [Arsenophonus endosymbiont of Bemisia tabaci]
MITSNYSISVNLYWRKNIYFDYTILNANKISVSHPSALFCI